MASSSPLTLIWPQASILLLSPIPLSSPTLGTPSLLAVYSYSLVGLSPWWRLGPGLAWLIENHPPSSPLSQSLLAHGSVPPRQGTSAFFTSFPAFSKCITMSWGLGTRGFLLSHG